MGSTRSTGIRSGLALLGAIALATGTATVLAFEVSNNSGSCLTVSLKGCIPSEQSYHVENGQDGASCVPGEECKGACDYAIYVGCDAPAKTPDCSGSIDSGLELEVDPGPKCSVVEG